MKSQENKKRPKISLNAKKWKKKTGGSLDVTKKLPS